MPYVELISQLSAQGHEIHFALRSLHKAYDIFCDSGVIWHQAPIVLPRHVNVILPIDSYTKVLHNAGYDTPNRLAGLITSWMNLYQLIDPDLIIFDFSPTAMLAARNFRAKTVAIGTGFHLPPKVNPIPSFSSELGGSSISDDLLNFENRVLSTINAALDLVNINPLPQFRNLLDADKTVLRTLPEMDHYTSRSDVEYAGIMKSPPGETPAWPNHAGPKIFAYLKSFETLPNFLHTLNQKRYPTLIYGDKIPEEIMQQHSSDTLHFVPKPLDMDAIGNTADVAICNAGHGATTQLLLSGVPLLLLPLNAEQNMVARNVESIGAGLSAPQLHPEGMKQKLDRVINEHVFKEAALEFSQRYRNTSVTNLSESVLNRLNTLL
jgi:hypothetical protein